MDYLTQVLIQLNNNKVVYLIQLQIKIKVVYSTLLLIKTKVDYSTQVPIKVDYLILIQIKIKEVYLILQIKINNNKVDYLISQINLYKEDYSIQPIKINREIYLILQQILTSNKVDYSVLIQLRINNKQVCLILIIRRYKYQELIIKIILNKIIINLKMQFTYINITYTACMTVHTNNPV